MALTIIALALFVDIIHTDATKFGAALSTGTVDFWPNGGKDQPGCPPFDESNILIKESKKEVRNYRDVD